MSLGRRIIGGTLSCLLFAMALQTVTAPVASATSCGVWRWPVKTLSDRARTKVDFTPKTVHIDRLRNLTAPSSLSTSTHRIKGVEFKTYRLKVKVREAKIEDDSDIHLVIASRTARRHTMIVEFPHPSCVDKPFKRHAMRAARSSMLNNCGSLSTSSFTKLKGNVTIIGVGFWDEKHGQTGVAPNGRAMHRLASMQESCETLPKEIAIRRFVHWFAAGIALSRCAGAADIPTRRRRPVTPLLAAMAALVVSSCGSHSSSAAPSSSGPQSAAVTTASTPTPNTIPSGCNEAAPCTVAKGTYTLTSDQVIEGLRVTIPSGGWTSGTDDVGELTLIPPGAPNDRVFFWLNMSAVKSTGAEHGTVLNHVGMSSAALVAWLTHNPDFQIVSAPKQTTVGGVKTTTLVAGVSPSAHFGDPGCPTNPRCAAFFTNTLWQGGDFYAIGGTEQVQLYIGKTPTPALAGATFMLALDAPSQTALRRLAADARPIINSLHFG